MQTSMEGTQSDLGDEPKRETDLPVVEEDEPHRVPLAWLTALIGTTYRPLCGDECSLQGGHREGHVLDCTRAIHAMNWFNSHVAMTAYPCELRWKACSLPWLQLPRWKWECLQEIHMYLDGSAIEGGTGAGVAIWVYAAAQGRAFPWGFPGRGHRPHYGDKWSHDVLRTRERLPL